MRKYTKLCLATLCFMASSAALADGYKGEAPPLVPVSIPSFNGGFEFTLGALYMTPESTNTNYLGIYEIAVSPGAFAGPSVNGLYNWRNEDVNPRYDWGFVLGLGYVIPNTANDVKLDWMYFHNDDSDSNLVLGNGATWSRLMPAGIESLSTSSSLDATGTMNYEFDAVDLTFGQYLNIGSRLQTRLFAGLRYMRLDSDLSTNYSLTSLTGGGDFDLFTQEGGVDSSFNGLGPLFGIKADYCLGAGVSLSGLFDAALLVGQVSLDGNFDNLSQSFDAGTGLYTVTASQRANSDWDSVNVISPGFDAKFGINYKYQCNNGTQLALELGYQVTKYIDVIDQIDNDGTSGGFGFVVDGQSYPTSFDSDITNFRLSGPYLTLNVKV